VDGHRAPPPFAAVARSERDHAPVGAPAVGRVVADDEQPARTPANDGAALSNLTANATILRRDVSADHRILVVDDEPNIVDVIAMALRFQGFTVESAGTGTGALQAVTAFKPDLIVLDVMLPDMEGFEVARRLGAQRARVPIIFLTARDDTDDKVRGLSLGGDDYVTKPFSLEELVARIRSILRRSGLAEADSSRLVFEDLELDEDAHEVMRGGSHVDLTATEYRLLRYLMLNPRRVLTRAQLLEHVWDYDFGGDARVLETYVSYLRKKLDLHGPPLIHTVRGVGYALRSPRT
jgi:two-component system OmpR family response regulator